jgi:hypothetical protein
LGRRAIANAIFDATGLRFRQPPFTPEVVLTGLAEHGFAYEKDHHRNEYMLWLLLNNEHQGQFVEVAAGFKRAAYSLAWFGGCAGGLALCGRSRPIDHCKRLPARND